MNRLVLIGNGFDIAHGLKTSYADFINWYWEQRVNGFSRNYTQISEDFLCTFRTKDPYETWNVYAYNLPHFINKIPAKDVVQSIINDSSRFEVEFTTFFDRIINSIETKGWVDIENEYYDLLKRYAIEKPSKDDLISLNNQLQYLRDKLIEYLSEINKQDISIIDIIKENIFAPINSSDVAVEARTTFKEYVRWCLEQDDIFWQKKLSNYGVGNDSGFIYLNEINNYRTGSIVVADYPKAFLLPDSIMFLNFNYTDTVLHYLPSGKQVFSINHIHGKVDNPQSIIFGYGDELDDDYKVIRNINDNDYLQNIKSIKYLESDNYRGILSFIESAPFQICIMGHSCGNSDRTLLNTLFEHKNCVSIKPYYYQKEDGTDNYIELVQNISRNFTDMKLMRDRVVNKDYCEPLIKNIQIKQKLHRYERRGSAINKIF